jgi:hypothetical protein
MAYECEVPAGGRGGVFKALGSSSSWGHVDEVAGGITGAPMWVVGNVLAVDEAVAKATRAN